QKYRQEREQEQQKEQEPVLGLVQWSLLVWSQKWRCAFVERAVLAEDDLALGELGDGGPSPVGGRYSGYMNSGTNASTFPALGTYSDMFSIPGNLPSSSIDIGHRNYLPPNTEHRQEQSTKHYAPRRTATDQALRAPSTETDTVYLVDLKLRPSSSVLCPPSPWRCPVLRATVKCEYNKSPSPAVSLPVRLAPFAHVVPLLGLLLLLLLSLSPSPDGLPRPCYYILRVLV
ncbi:hypothetical protein CORC01_06347, partial [Colletotrichum orchidophilum]